MIFVNPRALFLLFIIIPIIIFEFYRYKKGVRELKKIGGKWRETTLLGAFIVKWFFKNLFFLLFLIFSIISLAGPAWGHKSLIEERKGLDVVLVVDISRSMNASDVIPSRMERVKYIMNGLVDGLKGSRFGLIVYKGNALKLVPSTEDKAVLKNYINNLNSNIFSSSGSNIENGLKKAITAFPKGVDSNKFIILFSDGEELSGSGKNTAYNISNNNIPVYTVGVGTEQGSYIPISPKDFIKTRKGNLVTTKLNNSLLKEIAEITKGKYFKGSDARVLSFMLNEIDSRISNRVKNIYRLEIVNHFRLFIFLALLCLIINSTIEILRWKDSI